MLKILRLTGISIGPLLIIGTAILPACLTNQTPAEQPIEVNTKAQFAVQTEQRFTLNGTVFHDYNGDGTKEEREPGIPEVSLNIGRRIVTTNSTGFYEISLPQGEYTLWIQYPPRGHNLQPFRYINISREEYKTIDKTILIKIDGDVIYDLALMQGFLTLPFGKDTVFTITQISSDYPLGIIHYVDRSNKEKVYMDWSGGGRTYDQHPGTDFVIKENTPILSAAPGTVLEWPFPYEVNGKNVVLIQHEAPYEKYMCITTDYGHLNEAKVKPGEKVKRGDIIGLSGKSGNWVYKQGEHLHSDLCYWQTLNPPKLYFTDPYRNTVALEWYSPGFWTRDNDPQYP
jgi:hypothetical protein